MKMTGRSLTSLWTTPVSQEGRFSKFSLNFSPSCSLFTVQFPKICCSQTNIKFPAYVINVSLSLSAYLNMALNGGMCGYALHMWTDVAHERRFEQQSEVGG